MCARALYHEVVPTTINDRNPGRGVDLDYVPNASRAIDLGVALAR